MIAHETGHLLGYAHVGADLTALDRLDAVAATVSWNTDSNGYWDVASNWSSGSVPGADDDVVTSPPRGVALASEGREGGRQRRGH